MTTSRRLGAISTARCTLPTRPTTDGSCPVSCPTRPWSRGDGATPRSRPRSLKEALGLIAGQTGMYFSLTAFAALPLLILHQEWSLAARLLAHFDQVHRDFGWIPLDERNVSASAYRGQVAAGLRVAGIRPDLTQSRRRSWPLSSSSDWT